MLNVNETELVPTDNGEIERNNQIVNATNCDVKSVCYENHDESKIQAKYLPEEKIVEVKANKTKPKKVSVVDFRVSSTQPKIDTNDISKQVNEIIDEAAKINEAKLNAENERKNSESNETLTQTKEINNNNNESIPEHNKCDKEQWISSQAEIQSIINSNPESSKTMGKRNISPEIPIQPILNEIRTFDFQEYSDNSLPVSTTSTLNTTETPSTGPESLITSDIEDGYKGNEVEKKRKTEISYEDSKEDFIESQFGFLSEHLDSKMNIDSDDEKTVGSIKTINIVSSTMINDKFGGTFGKTSPTIEKRDVIDELTQIINCNRLETYIKPSNEQNKMIEVVKRSSLTNFHIGAYSNNSNENSKSTNKDQTSDEYKLNCVDDITLNSNFSQENLKNVPEITNNGVKKNSETFVIPKPVGRSMSFHSTFAGIIDRDDNTDTSNLTTDLSGTSRSCSYISLSGISKHENYNHQTATTVKSDFSETTRKKSASELSIADTPSLQSIEVMKSILSSSRSMNLDCTHFTQKTIDQDNQRNSHENENELQNADMSSKQRNEPKTWKYQGPPSINVSTWGERPKSLVHIKSDNDYIFGGSSKMAALQKRFSGINEQQNHNNVHPSDKSFKKQTEHCDNSSCKLPVVRGVEYKKNIPFNKKDSTSKDTQDSIQRSFRPSYEISRIISQKQPPEKMRTAYAAMTLNRIPNSNHNSDPVKSILKCSTVENQTPSFDGQPEMQSLEQPETVAKNNKTKNMQRVKESETDLSDKFSTKKIKKPIFSQFTLRKTGLKEKILDESNITKSSANNNDFPKNITTQPKVNVIPTAPKPPPMPKKSINRPPSMVVGDVRAELLNSIRSFNREALKRNCIY